MVLTTTGSPINLKGISSDTSIDDVFKMLVDKGVNIVNKMVKFIKLDDLPTDFQVNRDAGMPDFTNVAVISISQAKMKGA